LFKSLFTSLGRLLSLDSLVLDIRDILGSALPVGVQDQTLVVFGLGQNAGPCVEKGRRGRNCVGDGLIRD
jgi:hypothetical protein